MPGARTCRCNRLRRQTSPSLPERTVAPRAFTLIELLIVVAIVAILAVGLVPLAQLANQRSKEQELRAALREIRTAIDAYKQATDEGRVAKKADESGYPPSLEVLAKGAVNQ